MFELRRSEWLVVALVMGFIVLVNKAVIHDHGSNVAGLLTVSFVVARAAVQAARWATSRRHRPSTAG